LDKYIRKNGNKNKKALSVMLSAFQMARSTEKDITGFLGKTA